MPSHHVRKYKYKRTRRRGTRLERDPGPKSCHPSIGKSRPSAGCFPFSVKKRLTRKQTGRGTDTSKCTNHSNDRCLLEKSTLSESEKESLGKKYLRPKRPSAWASDPDQWLDSNNIADVMKQYEEAYKDFQFLGVLPIDFAAPDPYNGPVGTSKTCLMDSICKLNLKELERKETYRLAAVFNLDPHFKDGSHWVGLFVDLQPSVRKVYYFDSYGIKPPQQIAKFMRSLTLQDHKLTLEYNARRFQFKGSECGMYSLYFIISMLDGANFQEFCHEAVPDEQMLKFRHWIFS